MLSVKILKIKGDWVDVLNAARTTVGKNEKEKEPGLLWKRQILIAEHSPIRKIVINWKWENLKSWVSVHFVRHKYGIEHWVKSQREDRVGVDRNGLRQDALVNHECEANLQEIIFISRKRLCASAHKETREAWELFINSLIEKMPELNGILVKECVYRGFCPEMKSCGYVNDDTFLHELNNYQMINKNQ